jgi:hypothetical protein
MGNRTRRRYKHQLTGVAARIGRSYRPAELRGAVSRVIQPAAGKPARPWRRARREGDT